LSQLHGLLTAGPLQLKAASGQPSLLSDTASEDLSVAEYLDQLQLQMKYLLFDLEATKRENRYLRQILDSRRRGQGPGQADDPNPFA